MEKRAISFLDRRFVVSDNEIYSHLGNKKSQGSRLSHLLCNAYGIELYEAREHTKYWFWLNGGDLTKYFYGYVFNNNLISGVIPMPGPSGELFYLDIRYNRDENLEDNE